MIKTDKLMIGDYITASMFSPAERVAEIYAKGIITAGGYSLLEDELYGIPITPEILKENGWEWDGMYATLVVGTDSYSWYKHEGILRKYYIHKDKSEELIFHSSPGLNYIHELQHALRLCGIDKEIVL